MAAGTGNLILKRGEVVPSDAQNAGTVTLLKGMPAAQIVGLSRPSNLSATAIGDYAYDNYPNRLWIGVDAYGTSANTVGGTGNASAPSYNIPSGADKRPIWMGAEIRANAAVYRAGTTAPVILAADWLNSVDTVLVTQKAIKTYVDSQVSSKGTMTSFFIQANGIQPVERIYDGNTINFVDGNGFNFEVSATDTVTGTVDFSVLSNDVLCSKSGSVTVKNIAVSEIPATGTYYPVFTTATVGNSKTLYIDSTSPTVQYIQGDGTLSAYKLKSENSITVGTDIRWGTSPVLTKHQLQLYGTSANSITIKVPASPSTHSLTLPASLPSSSGVLQSDSSGNLAWVAGVPSSIANDLAGGAKGYLPYQNAQDDTVFLTIGGTNDILTVSSGGVPIWSSTASINTISGRAVSDSVSLYDNINTGSITIGSGITSGSINIGNGTDITTSSAINIGGGAITSGTKTINIGTGGGNGSTTAITIGGGSGTTSTTCSVSIGCPSAATSNVYIANNKLTLGPSGSADRIVLVGDTTASAGTRTHTFPNKSNGNVVIVSNSSTETAGYVLVAGTGTNPATWQPLTPTASSSIKFTNETDANTKYPIAFIANTAANGAAAPATNLGDGVETTGYVRTDWLGEGTPSLYYQPSSTVNNTGNFPQPSVTGGTLYAAFFSGILDGGTWT